MHRRTFLATLLAVFCLAADGFAGARYLVSGGTGNWTSTTNWATSSGGASGASAPTVSDDVTFDSNSGATNITLDTSTRAALSWTVTSGYTGTITFTNGLNVSGNVTLGANMNFAGTGTLGIQGAGTDTITSNGKTCPQPLWILAATTTLADNWTVTGLLTLGNTVSATAINGFQITANGGVTFSGTTAIVSGTTLIKVAGTGTITGATTSGQCRLSMTIDAGGGTVTFAATPFNFNTGTLTYTSGTVVTTGSTLVIGTASTTLACNGITWNAITITGTITVTLNENVNASGLVLLGGTTLTTTINGNSIKASGGVRSGVTSGTIAGTTVLDLIATQNLDSTGLTTGKFSVPIHINASGGTITITSPVQCDLGKVTWQAGAVVTDNTWSSGSGGTRAFTWAQ